jgi:methionyl aminopeptidase
MIHLKSAEEIEYIAAGGAIIEGLFDELGPRVHPGVSTLEIDRFCSDYILAHEGASAAFKGLYGFPGSVCASVNEEVVHGIPSASRVLEEGDIFSVDVGVKLKGWCSDSAWTFPVGAISEEAQLLMQVTEESLYLALAEAVLGNHVGDIGAAVVRHVEGTGLSIIRELVGHGVGRSVHEEPQVPNLGRRGFGPPLREGMVLAIEPMLSAGSDRIRTLDDGWTMITEDHTLSAHFEHTVAVTKDGPQVLTQSAPRPVDQVEPLS